MLGDSGLADAARLVLEKPVGSLRAANMPATAKATVSPRTHISFDLGNLGGIITSFLAKVPGHSDAFGPGAHGVSYQGSFETQGLEPYERLMYDAARRPDALHQCRWHREPLGGIERSSARSPPPHRYPPGSYGPQKMHELMGPRRWWLPET